MAPELALPLKLVGRVARSDWTRFLGLGRVHQMEGALLPKMFCGTTNAIKPGGI